LEGLERGGFGVAPLPLNKQYRPHSVNAAQLWPILFPHTVGSRCLDGIGAAMVRAPTNGQMRASKERNAHACAKYSMMCQKSTVETIRNNQAIRGSYNGSVIMQTTQTAFHKQRKRDNANNASVIMAIRSAHNAIVISRFYGQAFVTFRNISSAYLSYRLSLYSAFVLCDSSGLALVHVYYSTPVLLCGYAHMRISPYCYIIICR